MRVYCAVYGCMVCSKTNPEISFFKLPSDEERCSEWLRVICRQDLANKGTKNYLVCEQHFNPQDVLPGSHRKRLKTNSVPCLLLPELLKKDVQVSTEAPLLVEKGVQAISLSKDKGTQTPPSFSSNSPRKRKLESDLLKCKQEIKIQKPDDR